MTDFPVRLKVLKSSQDLGIYYVALIPVDILLKVAYSDPFREELGNIIGIQRREIADRQRAIRDYIVSEETVFPNSLVLGANFNRDGFLERDQSLRWYIEKDELCDGAEVLVIPTDAALASIIDGQHRLGGFKELLRSEPGEFEKNQMDLICSIYLDLPTADQAYIFATINSTQKKVDKSLAYELYGFNLTTEPSEWSPEKLAISLTRRLNVDQNSPLKGHIPIRDQTAKKIRREYGIEWTVSTASVVDGILRLITTDPARDRNLIGIINRKKALRDKAPSDSSPLRPYYLSGDDALIYGVITNFFESVKENIWSKSPNGSFIYRTVGFQALFDLLNLMIPYMRHQRSFKKDAFDEILKPLKNIDFNESIFDNPSAVGRTRFLNALALAIGFKQMDEIHGNAIPKLTKFFQDQNYNLSAVPIRRVDKI